MTTFTAMAMRSVTPLAERHGHLMGIEDGEHVCVRCGALMVESDVLDFMWYGATRMPHPLGSFVEQCPDGPEDAS